MIAALPQQPGSRRDAFLAAWGPLIAGLLLATSYWHVHFSRFSQRTILTPFALGLAAWGFWRGANTGRLRWWALAGAGIGIGLHSYSAGRFFPVFIALFLAVDWLVNRRRERRPILIAHWRGILLMVALAALIFAPLGIYFVTHPGSFFQRASAVATYVGAGPSAMLGTIGQSALANLAQYVVPGAGDKAQFHNLPGRPIFEPLTAILALAGLAWLLTRPRQPVALFLLLWVGVMTLPAALATDRFPTLPRVLGVLPGLAMFPTFGLALLAAAAERVGRGTQAGRWLAPAAVVLALLIPAAITARDYFLRWGPSPVTFDAFDGDMTSAWQWIRDNQPKETVYLSSDIYRHPTYMYLGEHATVTGYFEHFNPFLSWFDARGALPVPDGLRTLFLIGSSAPPAAPAAVLLNGAQPISVVRGPDGTPALTVLAWAGMASAPSAGGASQRFGEELELVRATWGEDGLLQLTWRTRDRVPADWGGYRLEIESDGRVSQLPFDSFRAPEWRAPGSFISWHALDIGQPAELRLRLLRAEDGHPLGTGDGWQSVPVGK
jgi:hypothetical protein